jgi:hypothetical protein
MSNAIVMSLVAQPTSTVVVQNDKTINEHTDFEYLQLPVAPASEAHQLNKLEEKRKLWETTAYRTSNQQLYALLADCLEYGCVLDLAESKIRNKELDTFFAERSYTVKRESPLFSRIAKAVFGNIDRRRISTYSMVLRSAQKAGINPSNLAEWIETNGGIQEIRLARSDSYVSPKQKADKAKLSFSDLPNLAVAKDGLALLADAEHVGTECVLLAEQQADGSFHIKALTRSATAVNAALTALYAAQAAAAA